MSIEVKSNSPLHSVPEDYCPPGSDRWFKLPGGHDAGKLLFYYDHSIAEETPQGIVLFVHGNPECSYTYRHVRDELLKHEAPIRIVAVDHIGFGISDQASFEMVDMHHSANLEMLIDHLDLRNVTLVIHDWGGPIGIGAFAGQMDRVDRLVVLNSTIFPMPEDGLTYTNWPAPWLPWHLFPSITPDISWGGLAGWAVPDYHPGPILRQISQSLLMQLRFVFRLIREGTAEWVFSESLRSKANARSSKRNVLQTSAWGHGYTYTDSVVGEQDNHDFYRRMQEAVPSEWGAARRNIPVAGHFGTGDPCGKDSVIRQWREALPRMREHTHVYSAIGHFVEEHKGSEIAASILSLNGVRL